MRTRELVFMAAGALLAGCYRPQIGNGALRCGPQGLCPDGYTCSAQNLCANGKGELGAG